ncbi:MAG: hypothetical protein ACEPOW_06370 [Bacteroidales bacterium]
MKTLNNKIPLKKEKVRQINKSNAIKELISPKKRSCTVVSGC